MTVNVVPVRTELSQPRPQGFSLKNFLREKPWGRGWELSMRLQTK